MMGRVLLQSTVTNGLKGMREMMSGVSGETSGEKTLIREEQVTRVARHGGRVRGVKGGIAHGGKITMSQDGSTNLVKVVAESIGTPMKRWIHGMKKCLTLDLSSAWRVLADSGRWARENRAQARRRKPYSWDIHLRDTVGSHLGFCVQ